MRNVRIRLDFNPFLNNLFDIKLVASDCVNVHTNTSTSEGSMRNNFVEINVDFMRQDKLELVFEAVFVKDIRPVYVSARLFNC